MKIGIFSKFNMSGGSERRCIELCNGITKYTNHHPFLLAEKSIPEALLDNNITGFKVRTNVLKHPNHLYDMDNIIIVNTDSKNFSTLDYWNGKSSEHTTEIDISKLKRVFFLYNFLISPSRNLDKLIDAGMNVGGIITTNQRFFNEVTKQDRYENVRILPPYILNSPIYPWILTPRIRRSKDKLCFGMHSKSLGSKWNTEIPKLIKQLNDRYGIDGKISFRFMGIKKEVAKQLEKIPNVTCLKENEEKVKDFLDSLDIFLFFPDYKREEPWARVIAEAMISGLPIIASEKGGTPDQVLRYNNGLLCKKYNDYYKNCVYLIEHRDILEKMSMNSMKRSRNFHSENIIRELMRIL